MIRFSKFINEKLEHQPGSATTQVATTTGTYKKSAELLKNHLRPHSKILDYGAGLGQGTHAMRQSFHNDGGHVEVHGYEPAPERSTHKPNFTKPEEIKDQYDGVVSHNVLNVLQPELRHHVTKHILSLLKPGGHAIIGARKWAGDVNSAKNSEPGDEPKSIRVRRKTKNGIQKVYQKGFDGNELHDYVKGIAGDNYEVKKLKGIASSAVHVRRIK
jgi:SAM-dependent methyltransferase